MGRRERERETKDQTEVSSNSISRGASHSFTFRCMCPGHVFFSIVKFRKKVLNPACPEPAALGSCLDHYLPAYLSEAAYTLLLYDELLEWSDRPLREFLTYPMQTEWQRKEHLHLAIIQNFDRGKVSGPSHLCPFPR